MARDATGKHRIRINVYRNDYIPAFGAWGPKSGDILLNVEAHFGPQQFEDGTEVPWNTEDRKRHLVETLMHEFGHALEQKLGLKANEAFMHRVTEAWLKASRTKYRNATARQTAKLVRGRKTKAKRREAAK